MFNEINQTFRLPRTSSEKSWKKRNWGWSFKTIPFCTMCTWRKVRPFAPSNLRYITRTHTLVSCRLVVWAIFDLGLDLSGESFYINPLIFNFRLGVRVKMNFLGQWESEIRILYKLEFGLRTPLFETCNHFFLTFEKFFFIVLPLKRFV